MATKQSTQNLATLIINKVPDLSTFHDMENNNQVNANELYFITEQETNVASIAAGSSNGTITVTTNQGVTYPVSITGLGSNAYTSTAYAPLASPALTGTPTAPTAALGTDTTQIATTAFVNAAITNAIPTSLSHTLTIGTYSFNGSADVTVPIYNGNITNL